MKKITTLIAILLTIIISIEAQPPQSMKYKAIAKDQWGLPLPRKTITLRFTIYQGSENGPIVYMETQQTTTTLVGLMDVNIGEGTPQIGDFSTIDWGAANYYIKVELDPKGGTSFTLQDDAQQLLSVPYALYAGNVQHNNDTDSDPQNELISDVYLAGTILYIVEGNQTTFVDLSSLQDGTEDADADPTNELQNLSVSNHELTLSDGNTVLLPDNINDADADPANEIQTISLNGNTLSLSNGGGSIELPSGGSISGRYYYADKDGDGFGDAFAAVYVPDGVSKPVNYSSNCSDCDDNNPAIHPGAAEIPDDGIDNDCNGHIDNEPNIDDDGDGFSDYQGDCNDYDASIHPGATDIFGDGIDQNCDGIDGTDGDYDGILDDLDNCPLSYNPDQQDEDNDGIGNCCDSDYNPNSNWVPGDNWIDIRDGISYKTVRIGEQVWMAENMRTRIVFGNPLRNITDQAEWSYSEGLGFCWYNNDSAHFENIYGKLYNWTTAQNVCPAGWEIPHLNDWTILVDYLGGVSTASLSLREEGTTHWYFSDDVTNESGFTALPGGIRFTRQNSLFTGLGYTAEWWSTLGPRLPYSFSISLNGIPPIIFGESDYFSSENDLHDGKSVRCIKY